MKRLATSDHIPPHTFANSKIVLPENNLTVLISYLYIFVIYTFNLIFKRLKEPKELQDDRTEIMLKLYEDSTSTPDTQPR